MLAELAELRDQTKQQAERLAEMESEVSRLRYKLDVERRFLEDRDPHTFKSWLRKQSPSGFSRKVLAEPLFPPKGSRALYEAHCRRLNCTEEEHADFIRLWKLMLLRS
jgi:hypothetical protein